MDNVAQAFIDLFKPEPSGWGYYSKDLIENDLKGGKKEADKAGRYTVFRPWDIATVNNHLQGAHRMGLMPLHEKTDTLHFFAIDIDSYNPSFPPEVAAMAQDLKGLAIRVGKLTHHLVTVRSKSGGSHLFLFLKEPTKPDKLRLKLREIMSLIGVGMNCEMFPLHNSLNTGEGEIKGMWINAPYFDASRTEEYALHPDTGEPMSLVDFIAHANKVATTEDEFLKVTFKKGVKEKKQERFKDGPPCINALYDNGYADGCRNNTLLAIGLYYRKSKPGEWLTETNKAAYEMPDPLSQGEIKTITDSLERNKYKNYSCQTSPLCNHCNRPLCQRRKYGVNNGGANHPYIEKLVKYDSDPPLWKVHFEDGRTMRCTTDQLLKQSMFKQRCLDVLNFVPETIKAQDWDRFIDNLLSDDGRFAVVDMPKEASIPGQLEYSLFRYIKEKTLAADLIELANQKPVKANGFYYISVNAFLYYLEKKMRGIANHNVVTAFLKDFGGIYEKGEVNGSIMGYYRFPEVIFDNALNEVLPVPAELSRNQEF